MGSLSTDGMSVGELGKEVCVWGRGGVSENKGVKVNGYIEGVTSVAQYSPAQ